MGKRGSKGGGKGIIIDLGDLARYRYLSLAWFARMAVAWLVGQDLFVELVNSVDSIINRAVEVVEKLRLGEKERGDVLEYLRGSEDVDLNTEHFMRWEVKERTRVFGGGGRKVSESFSVRPYVFGLYLLGRGLTRVGGGTYLLIEPQLYLGYFSLSLEAFREFYNTIRGFVAEFEREGGNNEGRVSETAFMTALAGLVINSLRRHNVSTCLIRELVGVPCGRTGVGEGRENVGNALVLYMVSKDGVTPLDLTGLVRGILGLERLFGVGVSRTLASLAGGFANRKRGGDITNIMNLLGDAVFRYSITGDLGPVYNMIRTVATSEEYAWVLKPLLGGEGLGRGVVGEGGD